ncbi:MAG: hypothetical protein RLP44_05750 [Aggregatilineales bacterium]
MIDLWERVSPIFTAVDGAQPEISVENISAGAMRYLINHVLHQSKSLDAGLRGVQPPHPEVMVTLPDAVAEVVLQGLVLGPLIVETRVDGYTLPTIGLFFLDTDALFISYQMGEHWTPLSVMALFELFRMIKTNDSDVRIRLSREHFNGSWRVQFDTALRDYLAERVG